MVKVPDTIRRGSEKNSFAMPVKDLVGHYESKLKLNSASADTKERNEKETPLQRNSSPSNPTSQERLHVHPLLRRREPSNTDDTDDIDGLPASSVSAFLVQNTHDYSNVRQTANVEVSADVTDESLAATGRASSALYPGSQRPANTRWHTEHPTKTFMDAAQDVEMHPLLPVPGPSTSWSTSSRRPSLPAYANSEGSHDTTTSSPAFTTQRASTATLVPPSDHLGSHIPIAASTIFARKAAPLSIPRLDNYIASLSAPSFPSLEDKRTGKTTITNMFPPMDRLAASGKTLSDLEHNASVAPFWRNRDSILSSLVSVAVGVTVSPYVLY